MGTDLGLSELEAIEKRLLTKEEWGLVERVETVPGGNGAVLTGIIRRLARRVAEAEAALEAAAEITGRCADMGDIHAEAIRALLPTKPSGGRDE